jgi:hypothetical protein
MHFFSSSLDQAFTHSLFPLRASYWELFWVQ